MRAELVVNRLLEDAEADDLDPQEYLMSTPRPTPWFDDDFTRAYIECALWSSNDESDESGGVPMDQIYEIEDIDLETREKMAEDCARFKEENAADLEQYPAGREWSGMEMAGHDFWLTRNHHGAGFWNRDNVPEDVGERLTEASHRFGEYSLYVGADGKIYGNPG